MPVRDPPLWSLTASLINANENFAKNAFTKLNPSKLIRESKMEQSKLMRINFLEHPRASNFAPNLLALAKVILTKPTKQPTAHGVVQIYIVMSMNCRPTSCSHHCQSDHPSHTVGKQHLVEQEPKKPQEQQRTTNNEQRIAKTTTTMAKNKCYSFASHCPNFEMRCSQ